jgi:uncharacterized protein involved in response to NO
VLGALALREVMATKNRNLPPVILVFLMGVANAADHAGAAMLLTDADLGGRAAISIVVALIALIGGRIIPSFTRNWMTKQGITRRLPAQPTRFDKSVKVTTVLGLLGWIVVPESWATGWLLVAAGCAQVLRLSRWGGLRTMRDPLLFILHIGYLWMPTGLLLLGASMLGTSVPRSAAVHALTAGAMATMILAVMTRVTLGHTGRELIAPPSTFSIYVLITSGAILRVAAALGLVDSTNGIVVASSAWAGAFVLFLIFYGPMLLRPRLAND